MYAAVFEGVGDSFSLYLTHFFQVHFSLFSVYFKFVFSFIFCRLTLIMYAAVFEDICDAFSLYITHFFEGSAHFILSVSLARFLSHFFSGDFFV